jgi:dolichyl-phosphate-mannose-protein mannosyltransferase
MQYYVLAMYSSLLTMSITVPYIASFLMLRKLNVRIFYNISIKEAILVGILTGQFIILIASVPITIFHPFDINQLHYAILIISLAFPIFIFCINYRRLEIDYLFLIKFVAIQFKNPLYDTILVFLLLYAYLVFIAPVDLSFDAANYYLPYSRGLLKEGFIPSDPFLAYKVLGAAPNQPQGLPVIYSFALNFVPYTDSFKLFPSLFFIQLMLAGSFLAKELYSRIPSAWVALIIIVTPPTFIYLTTTPYNADLLFYSFFVSALFFIIKAKKQSNVLWSILAGASITGMILTRDFGIFFLIPILSLILLGSKRSGKFWIAPLCLQLLIPALLLTSSQLSQIYRQHAVFLIILQIALVFSTYLLSRRISFKHNVRWVPLLLGIVPAIIFSIWVTHTWGSPISRTQVSFFLGSTSVDYRWATNIALHELKDFAFAIPPRSGVDMLLNIPYLFIAPAIGGLFFVPKIVGLVQNIRLKNVPKTPLVILLIIIINWLTIIGGFIYTDSSTFRHMFDVIVVLSMLSAMGAVFIFQNRYHSSSQTHLIFLISISVIFAIELLSYFDYVGSAFTLNSRTITTEPIFRFVITSIAMFSIIYYIPELLVKKNIYKIIRPYTFLILIAGIITYTMISIFGQTLSVIAANGGSYEKTYESILANIGSFNKQIHIQNYFNSKNVDGTILVYGADSLAYRAPKWTIFETRGIIDLALLKPVLTGVTTKEIIQNLKDNNIKYIVVPLYGDAGIRFTKLYKHTGLLNVLSMSNAVRLRTYGNMGIFQLR